MNNLEVVENIIAYLWDDDTSHTLEPLIADNADIDSPVSERLDDATTPIKKMRAIADYWRNAFTYQSIDTVSLKEVEPGKVVKAWKASAKHSGCFLDIKPTGKDIEYTGTTTYIIKDGKMVGYRADVDMGDIQNLLASSPSS